MVMNSAVLGVIGSAHLFVEREEEHILTHNKKCVCVFLCFHMLWLLNKWSNFNNMTVMWHIYWFNLGDTFQWSTCLKKKGGNKKK